MFRFFVLVVALVLVSACALSLKQEQDPCSGCSMPHLQSYQECMVKNPVAPCRKQPNGVSTDNHCCLVQEKHKRCQGCKQSGSRPHYGSVYTDQLATGKTVNEF